MNTKDYLLRAHCLLASPDGWTQDVNARDKNGAVTALKGEYAVSWCAIGAINAVTNNVSQAVFCVNALRATIKRQSLLDWNDDTERTQEEVLQAFEHAIAFTESPKWADYILGKGRLL